MLAGTTALFGAAALACSSAVYLGAGGMEYDAPLLLQWATAATDAAPQDRSARLSVPLGGMAGALPTLAGAAFLASATWGWMREGTIHGPRRSENDIHGHSDWASVAQQRRRFWSRSRDYGSMVVAEMRRRDLEAVHGVPYDPDDEGTWGLGGQGELLVDDARIRSTHVLGIAGSGIGKSQSILATIIDAVNGWRGSMLVGDPKGELAKLTARIRRELFGHRTAVIGIGGDSINAMEPIDPRSPYFETDVQALVDRMFVEKSPGVDSGDGGKWELWGKTLVCAVVAHMCFDPDWPPHLRNLRTMRAAIAQDERTVHSLMRGIADMSPCRFAREQAASVLTDAKDTWSGVFINAQAGTSWLSNAAYGDMVSDGRRRVVDRNGQESWLPFRCADMTHGDMTAYIGISPKTLEGTPNVARVVYGTFLEVLYDNYKRIVGRVLCEIDEAFQLRRMRVLERIRDMGRSAKITLRIWYQSIGQIEEVWGKGGKQAWYASTAYRLYAGVSDMDTAKECAELCGAYTAKVKQTGTSTSRTGGAFVGNAPTNGSNETETETARQLAMAHEFIQDWADDEVLIADRGPPIRAGLPLAYRRPELRELIEAYAANDNDPPPEAMVRSVLGMPEDWNERKAA